MTGAALVPFDVRKEIRALSGAWLACLVAVAVPLMPGSAPLSQLAMAGYLIGVAALGALAIGHEYSHGTLALLLSQPVPRRRVLLVKLGVLAVLLLPLTAIVVAGVPFRVGDAAKWAFVFLPVLCALFVAPWLTMWSRSPIAGAVFTLALLGLMLVASPLLPLAASGNDPDPARELIAFWRGTLVLCAVGAVMTWRMFMRLEATADRAADISLPLWLGRSRPAPDAASTVTTQHPTWLLAKKELRLQQLAVAIAGLYLLGCAALWLSPPSNARDLLGGLTGFYIVLMPLVTGSLASAEERRLGTLGWQQLLPVKSGTQWIVKVGVAIGLALLAIGLPLGLAAFITAGQGGTDASRSVPLIIVVAALTVLGLYVSSLCTSGIRALVVSIPSGFAVIVSLGVLAQWLLSSGRIHGLWSRPVSMIARTPRLWQRLGLGPIEHSRLIGGVQLLLVLLLLAVVLRVAFANHRSAQPADGRVWRQAALMVSGLTAGVLALAGLSAV